MIQALGEKLDGADDRQRRRTPRRDHASRRSMARPAHFARRRHVDVLTGAECEGAEHAPDRLGEALRGVLRRRTGVGKAAIPGRRPAKLIGGDPMDCKGGERGGGRDEQEDEKAVVGAAALGDRHDREPGNSVLRRHLRSPTRPRTAGASASMTKAGQNAREQAKGGENHHRGERQRIDLAGAVSAAGCAGGRERRCRRRGRSRRPRAPPQAPAVAPTAGTRIFSAHCGSCGLSRIAWNSQPFGGETVERRQSGDRRAADQEANSPSPAFGG